jgi:uncharacterized protein (TIGR03435 family)
MRLAIGFVLSLCAFAQQAQFEVASIKPSNAPPGSSGFDSRHGRLVGTNVTLKRSIMGAYAIGPNQIVGGPDWLDSDRFDINAKAGKDAGDREMMVMLQALLAERFHLESHRETRPVQCYVIEVAKGGPKLEKSTGESSSAGSGRGRVTGRATGMDRFAQVLAREMDLPVVNQTGLEGKFNFKLEWTPEIARQEANAGPSIFTAIQEQLGLRLRAQKVPIEVLVIDRAEKPTEN